MCPVSEWVGEAEARIALRNTDELIILRDALGAGERASLNLASAEADSEVRNGDVLRLAGAM